jgi:plastocyanin
VHHRLTSIRHLVGAVSIGLLAWSVIGLATRDAPAGPQQGAPGHVQIADFRFGSGHERVAVGSTVKWTNDDSTAHTVDSSDKELDSDSIAPGAEYEHTFDAPGTYAYVCAFHPFMKAVVEVTG